MEESRELVLPCGHHCLTESLGITRLTCIICGITHTLDLHEANALPPDLDLQESRPCPVHGDPIRMWCQDCMEPACGLCIFDKHPIPVHTLVSAVSFVTSIKKDLLNNSHRMRRQVIRNLHEKQAAVRDAVKRVVELFGQNQALHEINNDLQALIPAVESATGVRSLHRAQSELKRIQAKAWTVPVTEDDESDEGNIPPIPSRGGSLLCSALELWAGQIDGPRLVWDANRLLLCAPTAFPQESLPVLQLMAVHTLDSPEFPEVFLELSLESEPLGIVYIKLWGHLRRAQNFMLLCLGTLGPSFVGSHLLPVTMKGTPSEAVGAGMYRDNSGRMSASPLLSGLEWGGAYETPISKGLLVANSMERSKTGCLYSIITGSGLNSAMCSCKFGWVSDGLNHLRDVTYLDQVEQVWVSRCGLVLPRRS